MLFVVSRSLMLGRGAEVSTAVGGQVGAFLQVAAVALGIGELVERSVVVFTVIKLAAPGYLAWLGVQAIRHRHSLAAALEIPVPRKSTRAILRDGIVVGVSNPKVIVFFVAVLPQFADRSAGHVPAQLLLLGLIWNAIALACDSTWALAAGTARAWLARSPRRRAGGRRGRAWPWSASASAWPCPAGADLTARLVDLAAGYPSARMRAGVRAARPPGRARSRPGRDDPDDGLVQAALSRAGAARPRPGRSSRPRATSRPAAATNSVRGAPVPPRLKLGQLRVEAHLAEQAAVALGLRNAGVADGVAEHLGAQRPSRGGHVVVDADPDVHGQRHRAGVAAGPRGTRVDQLAVDRDALGGGPVEQRPVRDLARQPEHLRAERGQRATGAAASALYPERGRS